MYASITDPEGGFLKDSWKQFEKCTGITISYTGDKEFETAIKTKVEGGNAPDIAIFPQPGLVKTYAEAGKLKPASQAVFAETKANWNADWVSYGSPDGVFFAAPLGANAKSLVWYSPKAFKKAGYAVPTTWDEMIALSDKIVASGQKPWCAGIESGTATGWVATDWMEEVMLRMYGPDVYDQWVQHKIPFNDQKVQDVIAKVGTILKNPKYVNAGIGDVKSIATTAFAKAGLPIEKGKCWMHQQASFYGANWDKGYTVAPDGDLFAFYEPTISDKFGNSALPGQCRMGVLAGQGAPRLGFGQQECQPQCVHRPGGCAVGEAADRPAGNLPLRRFGRHAELRRCRYVLDPDDGLDSGSE
jgi:alpha-glucoside transport system substrate-binding protein